MTDADRAAKIILKDEIDFTLSAKRGGVFVLCDTAGREIGTGATGEDAIVSALASNSRQAKQNRCHIGIALAVAADADSALEWARRFVDDNDEEDGDEDSEDSDIDALEIERE